MEQTTTSSSAASSASSSCWFWWACITIVFIGMHAAIQCIGVDLTKKNHFRLKRTRRSSDLNAFFVVSCALVWFHVYGSDAIDGIDVIDRADDTSTFMERLFSKFWNNNQHIPGLLLLHVIESEIVAFMLCDLFLDYVRSELSLDFFLHHCFAIVRVGAMLLCNKCEIALPYLVLLELTNPIRTVMMLHRKSPEAWKRNWSAGIFIVSFFCVRIVYVHNLMSSLWMANVSEQGDVWQIKLLCKIVLFCDMGIALLGCYWCYVIVNSLYELLAKASSQRKAEK